MDWRWVGPGLHGLVPADQANLDAIVGGAERGGGAGGAGGVLSGGGYRAVQDLGGAADRGGDEFDRDVLHVPDVSAVRAR